MTAHARRILDTSIPVIGGAGAGRGQHCSAELVGLVVYGTMEHGYRLPCLDRGANEVLVAVNDKLDNQARASTRWRKLILRVAQCHRTDSKRHVQRMALWAARSVEHLGPPEVKTCNDVTERFLNGEATEGDRASSSSAYASAAYASDAYAAAYASAAAAYASDAYAYASAYASAAAAYASDAYASAYASAAAASVSAVSVSAYASAAAASVSAVSVSAYAAAAYASAEELMDWLDRYVDAWLKTAADEGCLLDSGDDPDYTRFLAEMDELIDEMADA